MRRSFATLRMVGDSFVFIKRPPRIRVGINGSGTFARNFIRWSIEDNRGVDVVAINAPGVTPELLLYLLKHNSQYSPFRGVVNSKATVEQPYEKNAPNCLMIEVCGKKIAFFDQKNTSEIPWHWMNVEYVLEASEHLVKLTDAEKHLTGGRSRKVIVVGDTVDIPIIFYPISYKNLQSGRSIISTGSPEALALATLLYFLEEEFGIDEGIATIVSGYVSSQKIVDGPNTEEWRLGRAACQSIIPCHLKHTLHTVAQVLPSLIKRIALTGYAVPVDSGNVIDLTCRLKRSFKDPIELVNLLRNSETLRILETIHKKCQPGWLLSQWCPEAKQLMKSNLPKIDCTVKPTERGAHTMPSARSSDAQKEVKTSTPNTEEIEKCLGAQFEVVQKPELSAPKAPCFLSKILNEAPSKVIRFWQADDEQCVGSDVKATDCMLTIDANSCLSLEKGHMLKLVAWFDRDMSFCKRILDLMVYMRYVDHS